MPRYNVTATMDAKWADAQRACYVALRTKGWIVGPSRIGVGYWQAIKPETEDSVSAKSFRELLDLATRKDEAHLAKKRKEAANAQP